jgi:hypothetical protein
VREALRELPLPIRLHVVADGEQVLAFSSSTARMPRLHCPI